MRRAPCLVACLALACGPKAGPGTGEAGKGTGTGGSGTSAGTDSDAATTSASETEADTDAETEADTESDTDEGLGCPDAPSSLLQNPGCGPEQCGDGEVDVVTEPPDLSCEEQCDTQPTSCGALGYPGNVEGVVPCTDYCRFDVGTCDECVGAGNTVACGHPIETLGNMSWFEVAPRGEEIGVAWQENGEGDLKGVYFGRYGADLSELSRAPCLAGRAYVALAALPDGWVLVSSSFGGSYWVSDLRRIDASGEFVGEPVPIDDEAEAPSILGREAQGGVLITDRRQGDSRVHRIADDGTLAWSLELDFTDGWDSNFNDGVGDGDGVVMVGGFDVSATRVSLDGVIEWHTPIGEGSGGEITRTATGYDVFYGDFDANAYVVHLTPDGTIESSEAWLLDGQPAPYMETLPTSLEQPLVLTLGIESLPFTELDIRRLDGSMTASSYRLADFPLGVQTIVSAPSELGLVMVWDAQGTQERFGMAVLDEL